MIELWLLVGLAVLGTFVWRFLGVVIGDRIASESFFSDWINAVAYAMVSGVMMLIVVFPNGLVAETSLIARMTALVLALSVMLWHRNMITSALAGLVGFLLVSYFAS